MPKQGDHIQTYERVQAVMKYILDGYTSAQIVDQCKLVFTVEERQARTYISKAYLEFKKVSRKNMQEKVGFYLSAKLKLYNKLKEKETPSGAAVALDILESMEKIDGIVVQKIDLTSKGKELGALTGTKVVHATLELS
jgi:hypothetical protein